MASDYDPSRGHCPDETQEIRQIDKQLAAVWPTFVKLFKPKIGWPYEVSQDEEPAYSDPKSPSFSTNAMILFAMGLRLGRLDTGVLAPRIRWPSEKLDEKFKVEFENKFKDGLELVAGWSYRKKSEASPVIKSDTFGDNDPFTIAWLLYIVMKNGSGAKIEFLRKTLRIAAQKRLGEVFRSPIDALDLKKGGDTHAVDHVFPLLRWLHVYEFLRENLEIKDRKLTGCLQTYVRPHLVNRINSCLASDAVRHGDFDAAELVFALEGILLIDEHASTHLIDRAFDVIVTRQKTSAYWRPLKPFVTTRRGLALLPLSVEIANSLLRICNRLEQPDAVSFVFSERLNLFKRYTEWLLSRVVSGEAVEKKKKQVRKEFIGWHSEHVHEPRKCHPWQTAQVSVFLMHYRSMLEEHVARQSLRDAKLSISPRRDSKDRRKTPTEIWEEEWADPTSSSKGAKQPASIEGELEGTEFDIVKVIRERYIEPRDSNADGLTSQDPHYSMLLFGPPGTGKTTIAKKLATSLNYQMIKITPSNFLAGGEAELEMRAAAIFDALNKQFDCVILFDEIDELILDRESTSYEKQTGIFKFMTPGMLTKLDKLRDRERSIFIIATNYEDRIDRAAKRQGRIDDRLLVCPPDSKWRRIILQDRFRKKLEGRYSETDARRIISALARKDRFISVIERTVNASYRELTQLADEAWKSRSPRKEEIGRKVAILANALKSALKNQKGPAIRLLSYSSRFKRILKDRAPQAPILEFLVLLFLLVEAQKKTLSTKEKKLALEVIEQLCGEENPEASEPLPMDPVAVEEKMKDIFEDEALRKRMLISFAEKGLIEDKKK